MRQVGRRHQSGGKTAGAEKVEANRIAPVRQWGLLQADLCIEHGDEPEVDLKGSFFGSGDQTHDAVANVLHGDGGNGEFIGVPRRTGSAHLPRGLRDAGFMADDDVAAAESDEEHREREKQEQRSLIAHGTPRRAVHSCGSRGCGRSCPAAREGRDRFSSAR